MTALKRITLFFVLIVLALPLLCFAAFPVKYDNKLDITNNDIVVTLKNKETVKVSATRPMKPMQEFTLTLQFSKPNIKSVYFTSNMEMNMGKFEYNGNKISNSKFSVNQILTKCMSGRTKWYTKTLITYDDSTSEEIYFFYDVK